MALKTLVLRGSVLVLLLSLGACASSEMNGYSSAPAAQISVAQNPYIHAGKLTGQETQVIINLSGSCHKQHASQQAGIVQSFGNGAVSYGAAGGLVGPGAAAAFPGASMGAYSIYGMVADAGEGGVNGMVSGSYSLDTATANCTRVFTDQLNGGQAVDHPEFRGMFDGLDIEAASAGKAIEGDRPPALDNKATWPLAVQDLVSAPPKQ